MGLAVAGACVVVRGAAGNEAMPCRKATRPLELLLPLAHPGTQTNGLSS
jgi:hypothetical protein